METNKKAGVLCPISALPSRFGIGDFGEYSRRFAKIVADNGYKIWQILPLNPLGYGHSPYQPFSSFALEELYVDLDDLFEKGLIEKAPSFHELEEKVLYEDIRLFKMPYLKQAFKAETEKGTSILNAFIETHSWVRDFALFMMNKRRNDMRSWDEWADRERNMIHSNCELTKEEQEGFDFEVWLQKTLYEQWDKLHSYCRSLGLKIVGDVPFYVGFDSADVWGNQKSFLLDPETKKPTFIAGVPPDYFSVTGQRWGNPIYDWDALQKDNFSFIINRLRLNCELYDIIRLDHFRAFDTFWKIPAACPTAIEGEWILAPGYAFFDTLLKLYPDMEIIAEDLGDLRPEVLTLRDHYSFPGMNVVEFTFHEAEIAHKEGFDKENMVAYLGTHDNDTMKGYFDKLPVSEQDAWREALSKKGLLQKDIVSSLINYTFELPAKYAIISIQDLLELGSEGRINVPGIIDEVNWTFRLTSLDNAANGISKFAPILKKTRRA